MDDNYVYDNQYFLDKLYSFNIQNLNCILDDLKEGLVNNYVPVFYGFYNDNREMTTHSESHSCYYQRTSIAYIQSRKSKYLVGGALNVE